MKILMTTVLKKYDGKPIMIPEDPRDPKSELKEFTVLDAIDSSLNGLQQQLDHKLTGEESAKIYRLTIKAYSGKEVDFTAVEIAYIIECAGEVLLANGYGQLKEILDPEPKSKAKTK